MKRKRLSDNVPPSSSISSRGTTGKVEVYLFRRRRSRVEFLILRRSQGRKLPGVWQPVTGKRERGESVANAARREVMEETGIRPARWWMLERLTIYLDPESERLVILPLLAAEVPARAAVRLSREHDLHRFVSAGAAARLFLWDSQRQALEAVKRQVLRGGPLSEALRITPGVPAGPRRGATSRRGRSGRSAGSDLRRR